MSSLRRKICVRKLKQNDKFITNKNKTKNKMTTEIDEIVIKGISYVPKESENQLVETVNNMPFVLIRGYASGVQYGYLIGMVLLKLTR